MAFWINGRRVSKSYYNLTAPMRRTGGAAKEVPKDTPSFIPLSKATGQAPPQLPQPTPQQEVPATTKKKGIVESIKGVVENWQERLKVGGYEKGKVATGIVPLIPAGGIGAVAGLTSGIGKTAEVTKTGVATITQEVTAFGKTQVAQRAFIGKPATTGVDKLFHAARNVASRYATNGKSAAATTSFLGKLVRNPATYLATIGTYPFAGFIKEEALQQLSFAFHSAKSSGDVQGMVDAITAEEEYLDPTVWEGILAAVPFANIVHQLRKFYEASRTKVEIDKRFLENYVADKIL